ncbi:ABC transporter ATP-binding protein [Geobacter sulfurreducens]|jgi:zinc transport system ATP-binding protein|uniref:Divalent manganese/zinc ABC transporter, ATP-binding protein n=1 Tax=Geobacter sulfurreducens (strain ATCC 51573 / DSM 12127 / PCA) TaxID=243231 RepID=Q748L6_GEOSL|nr:ABC transporter ATP-binding protein [Geobacter sulfurreducens]AAR36377.1 divalent manganese/zinc ABC transporter, ATP-binding protein [Geobacter sulfurreducens PCA]ADI85739.1 divalent manganese/zinc ABC transporter, ATP-binding protein [Geobacter sulfurreducens KN400]QVW34792.1 ABC transporter ATP-binding protein [Geobacter sulfurreducens]UAC03660.1 ABC transporter ATP-binding protein [Geobacter sulfurreducens]UTG92299.1 ABC transporter ATP-binding protein [Geobacter sulfurreducens]
MPVDAVAVTGVTLGYQGTEALTDVSFAVAAGDYVGIVGPNGSGKSTLIRCILGLARPDRGEIRLFGTPLAGFDQWQRVGYLPQGLQYFNPHFPATVAEVVGLGLLAGRRFPRRPRSGDGAAVTHALELMGIESIRDRLVGELSGGLRQRALLARALVSGPELLVLDEPTTALDPETRESFYQTIRDLNRSRGTTVILVTHDSGTIGSHASRFLYLDKRVVFYGGFDEFCGSQAMSDFFGIHSQHLICHRH